MRYDVEMLKTMDKAEIINALLAFQDLHNDYQEKSKEKINKALKELEVAKQEITNLNKNVEHYKHLYEIFKK